MTYMDRRRLWTGEAQDRLISARLRAVEGAGGGREACRLTADALGGYLKRRAQR